MVEAADIRVHVEASGVAETTAGLMTVDKAIDMVGDDSHDSAIGLDTLSGSLDEVAASATDAGDAATDAGGDVSGMGGSMGEAGIKADALSVALKVGLVGALVALAAPLVPIVSSLAALVAGLIAAVPAFMAVGGAIAYVGVQAIQTATHTDNLADAWAKLTKEGEPLGEALDHLKAAAKPMADEFMRFIETVGPQAINMFARIVSSLEDHLQPILDATEDQLGGFFDFVERTAAKVVPRIDNIINRIGGVLDELGKAFEPAIGPAIDGALTIIEGFADGIKLWLKPMIPFIKPVAKGVGDFLRELGRQLGRISKALAPSMPAFFRLLRTTLKLLGDVLVDIAPDIVEFVKQFAKMMKDPKVRKEMVDILRLFYDVLTLLVQVMPTVIDLIKPFTDGFQSIVDFFKGEFTKENIINALGFLLALPAWIGSKIGEGVARIFKQHGGKWMKALKEGILRGWESVKNWFAGVGDAVIRFWNNAKRWLLESGRNIITGLLDGIKRMWNSVVSWFGRIPEWIGNLWSGAIGWLKTAGGDVIQGFLNGLSEAWGNLTSWLSDRIASLPGFVKDFLGIGSPSKVFREIGRNTMKGMWMGLRDELPNVERALDDIQGKVRGDKAFGQGKGRLAVAGARGRVTGTLRIVGTNDLYAIIDKRVQRGLDDDRDFRSRRGRA